MGIGVTFVAFGEGSVWTGNYVDGTVSRIDPATNRVKARTSVSAPQALAAGAGSAWVSVAAGTTEGALTVSGCGAVASGGRTPDVLIASDLPLQGPESADPRALEGAIRFILERHRFRAGEVHRRLPILRCLDRADRRLRVPQMRRERVGVCAREAARGRDRTMVVVLRPGRDPDSEPRAGRPAGHRQPRFHASGAHPRRPARG